MEQRSAGEGSTSEEVRGCRKLTSKKLDLKERGEQFSGSTDLALKSARIVDLCGKLSGFTDFKNTVERGSAVIFAAYSGLCCLMFGPRV